MLDWTGAVPDAVGLTSGLVLWDFVSWLLIKDSESGRMQETWGRRGHGESVLGAIVSSQDRGDE